MRSMKIFLCGGTSSINIFQSSQVNFIILIKKITSFYVRDEENRSGGISVDGT